MVQCFRNPDIAQGLAPERVGTVSFARDRVDAACAEIVTWPGYAATPLVHLPGLAAALWIAGLQYKDEAGRFGLGSFKALGGPYAALRRLGILVAERTGRSLALSDLTRPEIREITKEVVLACATDGNHGRAVAWAARLFGCRAIVYMHENVSPGRVSAIAAYGAHTVRVVGTYEDSLRRMRADATANGWWIVSDTAGEADFDETQLDIMAAYGLIADEVQSQSAADPAPTHVFVQGGVGGLCAGVFMRLWQIAGADRPAFVVVEPDKADCLYRSAVAGAPVLVPGDLDTVMACLAAGEVNYPAWRLLDRAVDFFLSIPDDWAPQAMQRLAEGAGGDPPVVAGESGCAGLAGLMAALDDDGVREAIGLGRESRILLIGSEGATDPEIYTRIVGCSPEDVAAGKRRRT